jgi:D-alanine-D-alanine ligase
LLIASMSSAPRVLVFMGGPSAEHAVSLKSGHGVVDALSRLGYAVIPVTVPQDAAIDEALQFVRISVQRESPEVVFVALHGAFGEDGTVQQLCEELGVAYTGSDPAASRLGMDKIASRRRFEQAGLRTPAWRVVDPAAGEDPRRALGTQRVPVVVKPANQGSSIGVTIVHDMGQLTDAIRDAARFDARILIEAFVQGREVTVGIVADEPLPVVEIQAHRPFFDYAAKYTPGQTSYLVPSTLPARVARRAQQAALKAHHALGCRDFSRVDLIVDRRNRPVVLEVNTIPGLTPTSLLPKAAGCRGCSYDELCERLTSRALLRASRSPLRSRGFATAKQGFGEAVLR